MLLPIIGTSEFVSLKYFPKSYCDFILIFIKHLYSQNKNFIDSYLYENHFKAISYY